MKYIIEKRNSEGRLIFTNPQPEDIFGMEAITGLTPNQIYEVWFRHHPGQSGCTLNLKDCVRSFNPEFTVREKYW